MLTKWKLMEKNSKLNIKSRKKYGKSRTIFGTGTIVIVDQRSAQRSVTQKSEEMVEVGY